MYQVAGPWDPPDALRINTVLTAAATTDTAGILCKLEERINIADADTRSKQETKLFPSFLDQTKLVTNQQTHISPVVLLVYCLLLMHPESRSQTTMNICFQEQFSTYLLILLT